MKKKLFYFGAIAYVFLFILSIIFYKERTIFPDLSFQFFMVVKDQSFAIFHSRFIAGITQLPPLLALKLDLPLDKLMLFYSAGFVLYYFICYLLCGIVFRNYTLALIILLVNTLFVADTFFWTISELPLGMGLLILLTSILNTDKLGKINAGSVIIALIFIPFIVYAHPLMLFPFTYLILFLILEENKKISNKLLYFLSILFIIVVILKSFISTDEYDSSATQGIKNFFTLFPDYFTQYSQKHFIENWFYKYYWIPITSIAIIAFYFRNKLWKKSSLFLFYLIGYTMLVNISYNSSNTPDFYIENLYLPLAFIIALPLVFDLFSALKNEKLVFVFLALIIISSVVRICFISNIYTARLSWERKFLKENLDKKLIVDKSKVPMDTLIMEWSTPYDFWLLSTVEHGQTASLIIAEDANTLEWATHSNNEWLSTWGTFKYNDLPKRYFRFKDSSSNYRIVK